MVESAELDARQIKERTEHRQRTLFLIGWLDAEPDLYKLQQNKIVVLGSKESTPKLKGVENMSYRKNCYKRSDGRWQYSKQKDGYLYYGIANTYRELLEIIPNIKPKLIKNVKHSRTKTLTLIDFYQNYINVYIKTKNMKDKSKEDWQRYLNNYIKPSFQRVPLDKLTTEEVQTFINGIDRERTQKTIFENIVKVLKNAYVTGRIKKDITLGLEKPKRKNVKVRHPLTFHEQIDLLKAVKKTKLYTFTIFSIIVGSRREETLKFNLSTDLNEKEQTIHIHGTKTSDSDRLVNVSKGFITFLKTNMESDTFKLKKDYVTKKINEILKKTNMENCLHCLRHTCSANLYFLGAKDKYRQMQLGHSSIVTTNDIYTQIKENIPPRYLRLIYGDLYIRFD